MRYLTFLFALCALIAAATASTPPSFCKCTCFTNSTIIELTPSTDSTTQNFLQRRAGSLLDPLAGLFSARAGGKMPHGPKLQGRPYSTPHDTKPKPEAESKDDIRHGPKLKGRPYAQGYSIKPPVDGDTSQNKLHPRSLALERRAPPAACTRCNRAFCLSQNLPICKGVEEKDIQTSCFQRDSRKDQFVVLGFIGVTLGLLGWAGVREVANSRKRAQEGVYAPLRT